MRSTKQIEVIRLFLQKIFSIKKERKVVFRDNLCSGIYLHTSENLSENTQCENILGNTVKYEHKSVV